MVRRTEYLQKLLSWKDEQVIKVVTGIRRCGKSTLLKQYQALLRDQGVGEEQILSINFEELEYEPLLEYHALYPHTISIFAGNIRGDQVILVCRSSFPERLYETNK